MKQSFISFKSLYFGILALLFFCLPIAPNALFPIIIAYILVWIAEWKWKERLQLLKTQKYRYYLFIPAVFFICHLIGLFYSSNMDYGWHDISLKLYYFIFPILFCIFPSELLEQKKVEKFFLAFIFGFVVTVFATMLSSAYIWVMSADKGLQYFFTSLLTKWQHPSYVALMGIIAMLLCMHLNKKTFSLFPRWIFNVIIIVIGVYIFLLNSKAGIISLFLALIIWGISQIKSIKNFIKISILFIVLGAAFALVIAKVPQINSRFKEMTHAIANRNSAADTASSSGIRVQLWKTSTAIISENFWFGVGTGDIHDVFAEKCKERGVADLVTFNSHNQYLTTAIALGVFGVLSLLAMLFVPLYLGLRYRNILLIIFSIIFIFNCIVESMLERQAGILPYLLFSSIFVLICFHKPNFLDTKPVNNK